MSERSDTIQAGVVAGYGGDVDDLKELVDALLLEYEDVGDEEIINFIVGALTETDEIEDIDEMVEEFKHVWGVK